MLCNLAFNNSGVAHVFAGAVLRLPGGGTASGTFNVATNGLVDWTGSYTLTAGAQLDGDGLYRVSGGNFVVNGEVPVGNLDLLAILDWVPQRSVCSAYFFIPKISKYFPYPSFSRSALGMNLRDAEFMQ